MIAPTNILYITTECNLNCSYCYEKDNREQEGFKHRTVSIQEIDEFLLKIKTYCNNNTNDILVIFGGEPFVKYDMLEYCILRAIELKNFSISIPTNGTQLYSNKEIYDRFVKLYKMSRKNNVHIRLEISYDITDNDKVRGSSSKKLEDLFFKLKKDKVKFRHRYTISTHNYKNYVEDIVYSCMKIKPERIIVGIDMLNLEKELTTKNITFFLTYMKETSSYIYEKFKIPICNHVCDVCKKCDISTNTENVYYIPQKGKIKEEKVNNKNFDHFII